MTAAIPANKINGDHVNMSLRVVNTQSVTYITRQYKTTVSWCFFPVFFYVMPLEKQVGYQSNIFLYDGNKNQIDLIAKKAITPKRLDCLGRSQTLKK